jgi:hypothetical protein
MREKLKIWLLRFVIVFALACAVGAYFRAQGMLDMLQNAGYVPWPAGPDEDIAYVWRLVPGRYFDLIGADEPDAATGILVVGFALWMALVGYLLRRTPVPYIVSVGSLCVSFLCTGGFGGRRPIPSGFVVDAEKKIFVNDGAVPETLCGARFAEDVRNAARGGPDYWAVAHFPDGRSEDLMVFDTEPSAVYLLGQIALLQSNAGCNVTGL